MQNRGIAVCLVSPQSRFDTSGERAEGLDLATILLPAPTREPLPQRWIGQDDVVLRKRMGLVGDLVGAHLREACVKSRQRQWLAPVGFGILAARG